MPCKTLRDSCKERFCSGEVEETDCSLCKPCSYVCDNCCHRNPEETCIVNCMDVLCGCWLCRKLGEACSWIVCCTEAERTETELYPLGQEWVFVLRPCDIFMCDCCPKCSQCHVVPFFCSREYLYCLDFCDCCRFGLSLYDCIKAACIRKCNRVSDDMCGCYVTECLPDCCEIRFCCVCHCYTLKDCWNFSIEQINERAEDAKNRPQCCQRFSWCCLELRWRGNKEQALKELAGDLCRRGYTLQVLDSLGSVIDPQFYREAILSQPVSSSEPSPTLGYTDSYGGYVNFPENKKKHNAHKLGRHTSTPAFGRRSSRIHSFPTRLTRSLPLPPSSKSVNPVYGQDETILYNEQLHGSGNITHLSAPVASSTHTDSFYTGGRGISPDQMDSEEESERESRIKLQLAKDRDSETKLNIKSNDEKIQTISKKLKKISEEHLDTSGLDVYYENLIHKKGKDGKHTKGSQKKSSTKSSSHNVRHVEDICEDSSPITTTPSRNSHRDIRKTLSRDFDTGQSTTQPTALLSDHVNRDNRSQTRQYVVEIQTDYKSLHTVKDDPVPGPSCLSKHKILKDQETIEQNGSLHRQSSKKVRIDTDSLPKLRQDSVQYEDEVVEKSSRKIHHQKRNSDKEASEYAIVTPKSLTNDTTETECSSSSVNKMSSKISSAHTEQCSKTRISVEAILPCVDNTDNTETRPCSPGENQVTTEKSDTHETEETIKPRRKKKKKKQKQENDEFLPLPGSTRRKRKRVQEQTSPRPLPPIGQMGTEDNVESQTTRVMQKGTLEDL